MNNEPFVIERTYNAPAERVWSAITNKEKIKQWGFDMPEFKPEVGTEFTFIGQDENCVVYVHLSKVTEVVPMQKLSYTWRYEGQPGDSLVTFELFPEGDKTRLRLTHTGLETFPAIDKFARENFVAGWNQIIGTQLKDFLEA